MIYVLIIEDETTSLENLLYHLKLTKEPVTIVGKLESLEEVITWFSVNKEPDLIFMDIELKDGISFSIFERIKITAPIIFTTAFDTYMVQAFEQSGIDYLLKPIGEKELLSAISKYKNLKNHFLNNYDKLLSYLNKKEEKKRSRIIVKRGVEFQSVPLDSVAYFFTKNKVTFLVTNEGTKYLLDKTLKELEDELDAATFYRANRKFIININYIKSYKVYDKVKLLVEMVIPVAEDIVISQETASDFKAWISNI